MNHIKTISIIFAISLGYASGLEAQSCLTLQQCIDSAMQNNIRLKASRTATERSKASKASAIDIGNTTISLGQDPTSGGSPDNAVSIGQSFDFPTLYVARAKQKQNETNIAEHEYMLNQTDVARSICQTYALMQYLQEKSNILARHDSLCDAYVAIATSRQQAGVTSNLDVLNAKMLKQETAISIAENREKLAAATLQMQQYIGSREPIAINCHEQEIMQTSTILSGERQSQLSADKLTAAQKELNISKQGFLPTFDISLRWQAVLSSYNPYNIDRSKYADGNFMGFEVGMGFPLIFAANKSKVKAAKLAVTQQELEMADIGSQAETNHKTALKSYELAKERQMLLHDGLTLADDMERLSLLSYQQGEIGYVEHIANMRSSLDNRLKAAEAIYELNLSEIEVNYTQTR